MPITYDIKKDGLYIKGVESEKANTERALQQAAAAAKRAEHERLKTIKAIKSMLKLGMEVKVIAQIVDEIVISIKEIESTM